MLLDALLDGPVDGPVAGLLISKDGVNWQLFKKLWPFGAMYTTLAALETGPGGVATKSVRLCRCARRPHPFVAVLAALLCHGVV